ncbi:hypothetical protein PN836_015060 [Ningiella sp. W23]|uniref:hypothetical protein n=1 Tax=Ningiella sp. W23 TaxID=3023715 RepID=UPI0037567645
MFVFSAEANSDPQGNTAPVQRIVFWERNFNTEFLHASLTNYLNASEHRFGAYELVPSAPMEQYEAFAALDRGEIDVVVGSINLEREQKYAPIYSPIDRGLAGFRVCLIHRDLRRASTLQTTDENYFDIVNAAVAGELTIGLGSDWPDKAIYEQNDYTTVDSESYLELFDMLEAKTFNCFSRSMQEIDAEIANLSTEAIVKDDKIVFIYPNAAFLYTSKDNIDLQERLQFGAALAKSNGSYYRLFEQYYAGILANNNLYFRKLIFLRNKDLSKTALDSINEFGLASFKLTSNGLPKISN